ncbi:hypothetical protein CTI12_AA182720 [Artemisia annua]|uniref:Serine-threonine/tyrosine-protein kinase catalytic domain-containing protein n=1 Tax=Artemisia annua TaxID=35608 RepID=A0A2U1NN97_ARTAN|nr:hypothetical protein CTI12_AA182720 [Artemisia annua]
MNIPGAAINLMFLVLFVKLLQKAAIKKMDMQASREFLAELKVLTHVHHLNLVRLIGYCVQGSLFQLHRGESYSVQMQRDIRNGTGFVTFPVKYLCVVFRPFKGEILEATVTMMGFFAEAGHLDTLIPRRQWQSSLYMFRDEPDLLEGSIIEVVLDDGERGTRKKKVEYGVLFLEIRACSLYRLERQLKNKMSHGLKAGTKAQE